VGSALGGDAAAGAGPVTRTLVALGLLLVGCGLAWWRPEAFVPFKPAIVPALGVIMLGMGITLRPGEILAVLKRPRLLVLGVFLQYLVMPAAAWAVASLFMLSPLLAAGLVLTGACPGGTASNVMTYLARGNVALSVTMTTASTVLAPVATPALTWWLVGQRVEVPVTQMMWGILSIVIVPLALGMFVTIRMPAAARRLDKVFPWVSMLAIAAIVAVIIALSRGRLARVGGLAAVAVVAHNALGLVLGYWTAAIAGCGSRDRRTIALEVGMQNSGLATALAVKFFPAVAALPAALFSVWHNVSALMLAMRWRTSGTPNEGG
jgi:BASS family bile acid:Na+ symporter